MADTIGHKPLLFIADGKASAHSTSAQIDQQGGLYGVPLALSGRISETSAQWVLDPPAAIEAIDLPSQTLQKTQSGKDLNSNWDNAGVMDPSRRRGMAGWHGSWWCVLMPWLTSSKDWRNA